VVIYEYIALTGCVISQKAQNYFNVMEREGEGKGVERRTVENQGRKEQDNK